MLSVKENTTSATRKAILQLVGAVTRTVTVVQAAPSTPIPEAQNLSFGNVGDVRPFIVTSEVSWRATSSESWIQLTPSEGEAGTSIMNIEVTPNTSLNDRSGFVYIHIADRQVLSITVTQEGLSLKLSPEKLSFAADTESQKLQVTCNTEWSVLESPDWLSVSSTSGSGDMTLTLTAADYWNTSSRQGILRIGREGTDLQAQVTLTQEGRIFPNLIESLLFDALPSSQTVAIQTDGRWTTMISEAWIHVTPEKGTGDGNLQISVDENNNANEREGHISVTVGQITHTIVVTQQGRYFTVTPTTGTTLPSTGGKHQVHIAGNDPWTAKSSSSWIKLSATSGDSDIDVTLTASDNPSIHERKDTTVFTPAHLQPVKVVTTQQGRYLTVDVTSLSFFAQGGESEAITVNTDGTFTVTSSDDWITISQKGKTFTVTATENTTTEERRGLVTVSMTGLIEGESYRVEIPISQKAVSGVDISPFGDDQKWDPSYDDSGNLDVTPFTDDKSWD